jgi:hypothetical protein
VAKPLKIFPSIFLNLLRAPPFYSAAGGNPIGRENLGFLLLSLFRPHHFFPTLKEWGERTPTAASVWVPLIEVATLC